MKLYVPLITAIFALFLYSCDSPQTDTEAAGDGIDTVTTVNTMGSPLIEKISQKIQAEPNNASLYASRGEIYYDKDAYELAINDYSKAIELDSTQYQYQHLLADALLDNMQSEEAVKVLENVVNKAPERINTLLKLAEFQMILQQHDASIETVNKILVQSPKNAEGYYMLGMNYKAMGDTARAINGFQTTVEEDPDHLDGYVQLGILFDIRKQPIALKYFDNALRIDSANFDALFGKAWYYHQRNQYEKAEQWYEKTAQKHPKNSRVHLNGGILQLELSNIYKDDKKQKDALLKAYKKFDLATKVDLSYGTAYYYLGLTAEQMGNKEEAIGHYRQSAAFLQNADRPNKALIRLGDKPIVK